MPTWLGSLRPFQSKLSAKNSLNRRRLSVEALEDRRLLAWGADSGCEPRRPRLEEAPTGRPLVAGLDQTQRMHRTTPGSALQRALVGHGMPRRLNVGAANSAAAREKSGH